MQSIESEVECRRPERPREGCAKRLDRHPGTIGKPLKCFKQRRSLIRLSRAVILALVWESEGRIKNRARKARMRLGKGKQLEDLTRAKNHPD